MTRTLTSAQPSAEVRLTALSSCAGCAAKLSQSLLKQLLNGIPSTADARLLVGAETGDDAAVYHVSRDVALVQTVDFFTPIVDDPLSFGRIAATNAISDVYAMGGKPLTAMNILAFPAEKLAPEVAGRILEGGAKSVAEAGALLVGGHTIKSLEPIYGLSVTGIVHPKKMMTNAAARPGDLLVLTKPIGTGIATTGIKRGLASTKLVKTVVQSMRTLNSVGHELASKGLVRAATDITGFGLLGHLISMCRASEAGAEIVADDVPWFSPEVGDLISAGCIPGGTHSNWDFAAPFVQVASNVSEVRRILLTDAQTSGGLLLCVPPKKIAGVRELLRKARTLSAAVVGQITRSRPFIKIV